MNIKKVLNKYIGKILLATAGSFILVDTIPRSELAWVLIGIIYMALLIEISKIPILMRD